MAVLKCFQIVLLLYFFIFFSNICTIQSLDCFLYFILLYTFKEIKNSEFSMFIFKFLLEMFLSSYICIFTFMFFYLDKTFHWMALLCFACFWTDLQRFPFSKPKTVEVSCSVSIICSCLLQFVFLLVLSIETFFFVCVAQNTYVVFSFLSRI